jgi:hypothetical protein
MRIWEARALVPASSTHTLAWPEGCQQNESPVTAQVRGHKVFPASASPARPRNIERRNKSQRSCTLCEAGFQDTSCTVLGYEHSDCDLRHVCDLDFVIGAHTRPLNYSKFVPHISAGCRRQHCLYSARAHNFPACTGSTCPRVMQQSILFKREKNSHFLHE